MNSFLAPNRAGPVREAGFGALDLAATGSRVRALRKRRGWTQATLALQARLSTDTVHRIESGSCNRPLVSTLLRIAEALGCGLADLLEQPVAERARPGRARPVVLD